MLKIRTFQILILQGVVGSSPWQVRTGCTEASGHLAMMLGRCHGEAATCGLAADVALSHIYLHLRWRCCAQHGKAQLVAAFRKRQLVTGAEAVCTVMLRSAAGLGPVSNRLPLCRRWSTSHCGCSSWDSATLRCACVRLSCALAHGTE